MNNAAGTRTPTDPRAFLSGGGRLAELITGFDWSVAALPAVEHWPSHMKTATALMLRSKVPIVMLWGPRGVMVYNDAYAEFAGPRHPGQLGIDVRAGWPEVADFNDNVMKVGLSGQTLRYTDQELTLYRHGKAEQVWLNLDYSPLLDEAGVPAGVMAIVIETTQKVLAERFSAGEHERLARLFEQSPSFMCLLEGPSHVFRLANPNHGKLVGHRQVLGRTVAEALPDAAEQGYVQLLDQVYRSGEAFSARGLKYAVQLAPDATPIERYVDFVFQPIRAASGEVTGIFVDGIDVTDRAIAERRREALVELTESLRSLDDPADAGYAASKVLGETLEVSRVGYGTIDLGLDLAADVLHVERDWTAAGIDSLAGATLLRDYGSFIDSLKRDELVCIADVRLDSRTEARAAALESRSARAFVNVPVVEQGRLVAVLFVDDAQAREWTPEDLAFIGEAAARTRTTVERLRAVQALRESEARLRETNETLEAAVESRTRELFAVEERFRQAQKMEAIGQLTGGIAHDFNNLLATMGSSLQVLKRRLASGRLADAERYMSMAEQSVRRAASLTQRLLAFSRQQTLDPRPTDINRLIGGLEELIRRTVGPTVVLEVVGAGGLWLSKIDPPQLESAILNLCINGRDAMLPDGGRLTIETANKWLDERSAVQRELPPGQYVSVCVTDTGTGMSAEVIARAFDPFFTTKPIGQGTGLGLSMVYGFVRQSGGQVRIYSELRQGTTMCLYLPRYTGGLEAEEGPAQAEAPASADGECVVIVEDEETIRELLAEELQELGYRVVVAGDGPTALQLLRSDMRVDLLLTDVGLPGGLNGRQVADAAREVRPNLKVLFMTGYAQNAAIGNGLLDHGMEVITKPFDIEVLSTKVREMVEH